MTVKGKFKVIYIERPGVLDRNIIRAYILLLDINRKSYIESQAASLEFEPEWP